MSKVSVIIPVYNTSKYLQKCVESVLSQTFDDIEIILVNDGSTDNSPKMCDDFAEKYNNITVVHKENGGLSDARNAGMKRANGEYICFLDSDDKLDDDCIEESLKTALTEQADVVVWGYHTDFYDNEEYLTSSRKVIPVAFNSYEGISSNMDVHKIIGLCGYAWNKLYKAEVIKNIEFEKGTSLVEDILFNSKVFTQDIKTIFINKAFTHYIQRPSETLGTKYYPNYMELKKRAVQADIAILSAWNAGSAVINDFESSMFLSVCWNAIITILKADLTTSEKKEKIHTIVSDKEIMAKISRAKINKPLEKIKKKIILLKQPSLVMMIGKVFERIRTIANGITPEFKSVVLSKITSGKDPEWLKYDNNSKKVVVFLAGFYANLGDLAITYAQKEFLKKVYPDREIILVSSTQTYTSMKTLKKVIRRDDIITLIGGGNMSDLYWSLESARHFVIKNFKRNKIISFPQTVSFAKTQKGAKCLKKSKKVYSRKKNIIFFLREKNSFRRFNEYFPGVKCELCPDMVLSLNKIDPTLQRNGVVCCLRADGESCISPVERKKIISLLRNNFNNVVLRDTVDVSVDMCTPHCFENTLNDFWNMLKQSEVVVTDRLHCMIFCVITGTPCVAIDNSNKKISGVYEEWLQNIDWITFIKENDIHNIAEIAHQISTKTNNNLPDDFYEKFNSLRDACK